MEKIMTTGEGGGGDLWKNRKKKHKTKKNMKKQKKIVKKEKSWEKQNKKKIRKTWKKIVKTQFRKSTLGSWFLWNVFWDLSVSVKSIFGKYPFRNTHSRF